jgi:hypothetical protein
MTSEARLDTPQADALLALIGAQFRERAAAHPELGIQVDWSEERGSVDFGWGRCMLEAGPEALNVWVEADQPDDLEALQELITRHLERHGPEDQPIAWDLSGAPVPSARDPRRKDLMRAFHRRARHG